MAYGFGGTFGSGAVTDSLTWLAATAPQTLSTYHFRIFANGDGGGGFGRVIDNGAGLTLFLIISATDLRFQAGWDVSSGIWDFARPTNSAWHDIVIVYDAGATTNDPVIYVDGSSVVVTEITAPSGNFITSAQQWVLGNRASDVGRNWDGMIAEACIFDRLLTAGDAVALGQGASPLLYRLNAACSYSPLVRSLGVVTTGEISTTTAGGTAPVVQPHPRVTYPSRARVFPTAAAAAAGVARTPLFLTLGVGT